MSVTTHCFSRACCAGLAVALLLAGSARSATISYPDQGPVAPGFMFTDISESSGTDAVPLYGAPTAFATGLDFNPAANNFSSSSAGGTSDITDGQLNFTVMGLNGLGVGSVVVSESGDYTLTGPGGATTSVYAGLAVRATIIEVNNVAVAPISVTPVSSVYSNGSPAGLVTGPWSNGTLLDVGSVLGVGQFATKVEVVINNVLATSSEPNTSAEIDKQEFTLEIIPLDPNNVIPEPTAVVLAGFAVCGLGLAARRR